MNIDEFQDIHYQKDRRGIVTLRFNTPQRKNALSMLSFYEIYCAIDAFESDDSALVMIVTGASNPSDGDPQNQAFSSGGYFSPDALDGVAPDIIANIDINDIAQKRTTLKMFNCEKPIIAAVNGLAIGGGVTLILAGADQIYMSEHAWLLLPFAKLGLSAELASSVLLSQLLGMQKAKEILFYPDKISAKQAFELGLANAVVPHQELMTYAEQRALQLIPPQGAPRSIRAMKRLLHGPVLAQLDEALDRENQTLNELFKSADFAEAMAARAERRKPVFTGQ